MTEATSSGGVVIYRGKMLLLYKNYKGISDGWVLPKGTVEDGETLNETAVREVGEESGAHGTIVQYIGKTNYVFRTAIDEIHKTVHWFLMFTDSFYSKPQHEEFFQDSGFYKFNEAYHLLKYQNEKQILNEAFRIYKKLQKENKWDIEQNQK